MRGAGSVTLMIDKDSPVDGLVKKEKKTNLITSSSWQL